MTLIELQDVLGERIEIISSINDMTDESQKLEMEKADMVSRLANQMINNADVILRTDKLISEGKLNKAAAMHKIIGNE